MPQGLEVQILSRAPILRQGFEWRGKKIFYEARAGRSSVALAKETSPAHPSFAPPSYKTTEGQSEASDDEANGAISSTCPAKFLKRDAEGA